MEPGNLVIEEWARDLSNEITVSHDINIRAALNLNKEKERERERKTSNCQTTCDSCACCDSEKKYG